MGNPPTYTLIQTVNPAVSTGTITANLTNTKVGSLILVFMGSSALTDTVSTVTDDAGHTYSQAYSIASGSGGDTELWHTTAKSPITTVTITFSASSSTKSIFVREYGAMFQGRNYVLDTAVGTSGSGTAVSTGASAATRDANDLFVCNCSCLGTNPTLAVGAGFGNYTSQALVASASLHAIEDLTTTVIGTQTGLMTAGGTSPLWDVGGAAFFIARSVVNFPYPHISVGDGCSRNDWAT